MNRAFKKIFIVVIILAAITVFLVMRAGRKNGSTDVIREINPVIGSIQTTISTTGTVLPQNRLEIKPPVNGRLEQLLVKEGQQIKKGEVLAWMSSTERAALLDAAQAQGQDAVKYWEDVYKPVALMAPIDGEVIVATTQPGQTITTVDAIVVLSDHLIVRAQVDETDIGKIKLNQKALIALDAYPDTKIKAVVEHIYYESQTVNNVTIYKVDLLPDEVLSFFRSGMNASIDFIEQGKDNTLLIPVEAVQKEGDSSYVMLKQGNGAASVKTRVTVGISDDKNVEITSGITQSDTIILKTQKYTLPKSNSTGTNPFMPNRRR